jgi:hypothetical protein
MYATTDSIQAGSLPFKTVKFCYAGPKLLTPPSWIEQIYELNARDVLAVIQQQLATTDFNKKFDYVLYKMYNSKGEHLWSNLMSGHWAYLQVVYSLPSFLLLANFSLYPRTHTLAR